MRVLAISDKVEPILYSPAVNQRVGKLDMILACGDLPFYYIEYLMTMVGLSHLLCLWQSWARGAVLQRSGR